MATTVFAHGSCESYAKQSDCQPPIFSSYLSTNHLRVNTVIRESLLPGAFKGSGRHPLLSLPPSDQAVQKAPPPALLVTRLERGFCLFPPR